MPLKSWVTIPQGSHFSLSNLPFGIISTQYNRKPRPAVAIGDHVLDLAAFAGQGGFSPVPDSHIYINAFGEPRSLNHFAAIGKPKHRECREYLQEIFALDSKYSKILRDNQQLRDAALLPASEVQMHLPMAIDNYTDFYAGKNHAYNCGVIFRGPSKALQPNYTHLPVAYHGRASSIVLSGTQIRRPNGQILEDPSAEDKTPVLAPCRNLDIELELGAFICKENEMGDPVPVSKAGEHIFGFVLLNDWSARDIQSWEYVPLGPFNSKNFATSISPWVVLADAMEPFRTSGIKNETKLLSYLDEKRQDSFYNINLEVDMTTPRGSPTKITQTNARNLLFSFPQMLAHHTITGCPMHVGDLLGSGTISGTEPGTEGSLLEKSQGGKSWWSLGGEQRKFLKDGDTVTIRGWAGGEGGDDIVGFGTCTGTILPALVMK